MQYVVNTVRVGMRGPTTMREKPGGKITQGKACAGLEDIFSEQKKWGSRERCTKYYATTVTIRAAR